MISANLALWILVGFIVVLAIAIPLLDSVEKFSKFISLRWTCVSVILLIMVGVIINFNHLSDNTRDIVIRGGLIVVGVFLVLRTVEKVLSKGWLRGINVKGTIQKGDLKATAELNHTDDNKDDEKKDDGGEGE
jgi:hypothetical protein